MESLEKAKRSSKAYVRINGTFGLPTPFDITGNEKWSPGGELFREYDLELDDADDSGSWNDTVAEVDSGVDNDSAKIIDFSKMHQALGVKALSGNNGSQNKNVGDNAEHQRHEVLFVSAGCSYYGLMFVQPVEARGMRLFYLSFLPKRNKRQLHPVHVIRIGWPASPLVCTQIRTVRQITILPYAGFASGAALAAAAINRVELSGDTTHVHSAILSPRRR